MRKKLQSPKVPLAQFIAIIALTISLFLIVDFGRRAAANYRSQREAERLTQEVEAARRYQAKLLAQRTYAASDLYIEEIARKELKWVQPGEIVVVVLPTLEPSGSINPAAKTDQSRQTYVTSPQEAWWLLFFGDQFPSHLPVDAP